MNKCLIIGGGFSGLSAAVNLGEKNIPVHLIEASPKLGGRAYSLLNKNLNDTFDNGQHILMGCYYDTIEFLKKIKAIDKLKFQESLTANFVNGDGKLYQLKAPMYFYPLNLLIGILNYKAVSFKSRLKILDFFLDLTCCFNEDLKEVNVLDWLSHKGQTQESIKAFWEILVVGALNTTLEKASSEMFAEVLKRIFLDGPKAATILIPKVGLSELYVNPSREYILRNHGKIACSERALKFVVQNEKIIKVITDKNEYSNLDFVVSAIPTYALEKIEIDSKDSSERLKMDKFLNQIKSINYSPIINVHIWLNRNPFKEKFYGLIDSKIHWLFSHGKHISLTTSAAKHYIDKDNEEIISEFYSELEKYFPIFNRNLVADSMIIKEKRATFIPDYQSNEIRERIYSPIQNMVLAGDWINTGLPSTIEGAVLSGRIASEYILSSLK